MRAWFAIPAALAALALCLAGPAGAQVAQTRAIVVSSCGAVSGLPLNEPHDLYMTPEGRVCVAGAGGPSASAASAIAPTTSTTSSLVAKAGAGNLYGFGGTMAGTAGFIAILNAAAVPAGGAAIAPVECVPIAANASYRTRQDIPDRYSAGIVLLATSSCSTYATVAPTVMQAVVQ